MTQNFPLLNARNKYNCSKKWNKKICWLILLTFLLPLISLSQALINNNGNNENLALATVKNTSSLLPANLFNNGSHRNTHSYKGATNANHEANIDEKEAIFNAINKYLDAAGIKITDLNVAGNNDGGKTATGKVSFFSFSDIDLKADLTANLKVKTIHTTFPESASINPDKLVKFMSGKSLSSFMPKSFPLNTGISIKDFLLEFDDKGDSLSKFSLDFGIGSYTIDGFDGFAINNVAIGFILDKSTAPDHKATATVSGDGKIGAVPINLSANMSSEPDDLLFTFTATGINISTLLDGFMSAGRVASILKFIPEFFKSKQINSLTASLNPTSKNFTGLAQTSFGEAELQFNGATEETKSTILFGIALPADFKFSNIASVLSPMDGIGLTGTALLISTLDARDAKSSLDALKDEGDLTIKEGVNIFSTIQLNQDLGNFFNQPSIKLRGAIDEKFTDMSLNAALKLGLKLGENVTMQEVNFGIQLGTANPVEFTMAGLMEARVNGDVLGFNANFSFSPLELKINGEFYMTALQKMNNAKVTGSLGADGKSDLPEWTNPFGIPSLGLQKLGVSAGIDFKFVPIYLSSLGFTGAARFGMVSDRSKHIYGDVTVVIDVTNPTKTLVDIKVKNLTPIKIIEAYRENSGINEPFRTMLSSGFDSAHLLIVPVDGMVAFGKTYNKGISFGGIVSLGGVKGYADFNLNDNGVSGAGAMDPIDWGNGTFKLSGRTTDKPQFNFAFLKDVPPNLFIDGKISLLGISSESTVLMDDKGFDFTTAGKIADLFEITFEAKGKSFTQSGGGLYVRAALRNDLISKLNDIVTKKIDETIVSTKATLQGTRDKLVQAQKDLKEIDDRIAAKRAQITTRRNADLQNMRDEALRSMKEKQAVIDWHKANNNTSNKRIAELGNWPWELAEKAALYSAIAWNLSTIEMEQLAYSGYAKTVNSLADIGEVFPVEPELTDLYVEKGAKDLAFTTALAGVDIAQGISVTTLEATKFIMDKTLGGVFDIKSAEFEGTFGLTDEYKINVSFNITLAKNPYNFTAEIDFKNLEQSAAKIASDVLKGNLIKPGFSKSFAGELKQPVTNYALKSESKDLNTLIKESKKPLYKYLVTLETALDADAGSNEKFAVILSDGGGVTNQLELTKDLYSIPAGEATTFLVQTESSIGSVTKAQIIPLNSAMTDNLKINSISVQSLTDGKNLHADCTGTVISNGQSIKTIAFDGKKYADYFMNVSTVLERPSANSGSIMFRFTAANGTSAVLDLARSLPPSVFKKGANARIPFSIPDIGNLQRAFITAGSSADEWVIGGIAITDATGDVKASYCNCSLRGAEKEFYLYPFKSFIDYTIEIKTNGNQVQIDKAANVENFITLLGSKGQVSNIRLSDIISEKKTLSGEGNDFEKSITNYANITTTELGEVQTINIKRTGPEGVDNIWHIASIKLVTSKNGNIRTATASNIGVDKSPGGTNIMMSNQVTVAPPVTNQVTKQQSPTPQIATVEWANKPVRIQNAWKTGELINEEAGQIASSAVADGALTAQWLLKSIAGTNYFWIENKNKAGHRINIETGTLASSAVPDGAWSAHWQLKKLSNGAHWIENRWKEGQRLNVESGKLEYSKIDDGANSAMWNLSSGAFTLVTSGAQNPSPAQPVVKKEESAKVVIKDEPKVVAQVPISAKAEVAAKVENELANKTVRIENLWKNTERINEETGQLVSSPIEDAALSAQWLLKPVPGSDYFWIENKSKPGHRINIETGSLLSSIVPDGAWSAHWHLKKLSNGAYWIENRWKEGERLNIENGKLECSKVQDGANSAMWNLK